MTIIEVPFYINHGHYCAQAAMKSALKAVMPQHTFPIQQLEEITGHSGRQITLPCQVASAFSQLGIKFQYFVRPLALEIMAGQDIFKEINNAYGKFSEEMIRSMNLVAVQQSAQRLRENPNVNELKEKPDFEELDKIISQGKIPLCLINFDIFSGRENRYRGHYLTLTGIENNQVRYHNNGPYDAGANILMSKKRFLDSWNLCCFDHDLILVG